MLYKLNVTLLHEMCRVNIYRLFENFELINVPLTNVLIRFLVNQFPAAFCAAYNFALITEHF